MWRHESRHTRWPCWNPSWRILQTSSVPSKMTGGSGSIGRPALSLAVSDGVVWAGGGKAMRGTCLSSRLAARASMLRLMVSITLPRDEREASGLVRVRLVVITALLDMPTLMGNMCERRRGTGLLSLSVRSGCAISFPRSMCSSCCSDTGTPVRRCRGTAGAAGLVKDAKGDGATAGPWWLLPLFSEAEDSSSPGLTCGWPVGPVGRPPPLELALAVCGPRRRAG